MRRWIEIESTRAIYRQVDEALDEMISSFLFRKTDFTSTLSAQWSCKWRANCRKIGSQFSSSSLLLPQSISIKQFDVIISDRSNAQNMQRRPHIINVWSRKYTWMWIQCRELTSIIFFSFRFHFVFVSCVTHLRVCGYILSVFKKVNDTPYIHLNNWAAVNVNTE